MSRICVTCGAQYPTDSVPGVCRICADQRQWVPATGQQWTDLDTMQAAGHRLELRQVEPGLSKVLVSPSVGIGQSGYLLQTPAGNVLWDAPAYLNDQAVALVRGRGPVAAVAASHPHFYGVMAAWGDVLDAPVLVAAEDAEWVTCPSERLTTWAGAHDVAPGVRLVRCGGHFAGSAVLHWADGADGAGALLAGDTIFPVAAQGWVSFMYSFPNYLPLSAAEVEGIARAVRDLAFDRIYGGFKTLDSGARAAVERSAARYIRRVTGSP